MSAPGVVVRTEGTVLHVQVSVPERRNALSRAVLARLREVFGALPDVGAVVLSGTGSVFSAGADLRELSGSARDLEFDDEMATVVDAVRLAPVPVIAAIEGPCIGAAVDLALACDLRIAGADAWFRLPAVRLGILYNPRSIARWHRTLPRDTLTRLVLLGQRFTAVEAQTSGLVSSVVPAGQAVHQASVFVGQEETTTAHARTKQLLGALDDGKFDERGWQDTRIGLLESGDRQRALAQIRRR
jgi:enoyl-CoA hydratase/carnithine racemase